MLDSSEFENLDHSIALINQYQRNGALVIAKDTILGKQIRPMTPDDLMDKPEIRYYSVSALSRVLASFEIYPWKKSTIEFTGFSNIQQRVNSNDDWDGSYFEVFMD